MTIRQRFSAIAHQGTLRALAAIVLLIGIAVSSPAPLRAAPGNFASLLLDAQTGAVLEETNADNLHYPASLTKMMTLYMLFDAMDEGRVSYGDRIMVSPHAAAQPPTKLGIGAGRTIAVQDAILALITKSANDMAAAIAEHLGGSEENFARMMTARAHDLGMISTHFENASGLPNPAQVTTARDLGILALALLYNHPNYYHLFGTRSFAYAGINHPNHNRMLGVYEGMDGIKTGYTQAAGFNLAASAERQGSRLIGIVLGARSPANRSAIMADLLDEGFEQKGVITVRAHDTTPWASAGIGQASLSPAFARLDETEDGVAAPVHSAPATMNTRVTKQAARTSSRTAASAAAAKGGAATKTASKAKASSRQTAAPASKRQVASKGKSTTTKAVAAAPASSRSKATQATGGRVVAVKASPAAKPQSAKAPAKSVTTAKSKAPGKGSKVQALDEPAPRRRPS